MKIVIATCERWPDLSPGDAPLAEELTRRGHDVETRPWNASRSVRFTNADLVVLRSNWDYHRDLGAFEGWLDHVAGAVRVENDAKLVTSYLHKSYLLDWEDRGVPIPATLVLPSLDCTEVGRWMDSRGLSQAVCKPAWGASGHGVELIQRASVTEAQRCWVDTGDQREVLIQEFVAAISEGELAVVFFGGEFSHALRRVPSLNDFRVNSQYGGQMQVELDVDPAAIAFSHKIIDSISPTPSYARIDIARSADAYLLMEIEINEPALGLHLVPGSACRFADALLDEII